MNKEQISCSEAISYLNGLYGLKVNSTVFCIDGKTIISLGKQFQIEYINLDPQAGFEKYTTKQKSVYEYEIVVTKDTQILEVDQNYKNSFAIVANELLGNVVEDVWLTEELFLFLRISDRCFCVPPASSGKESWRIFQPETEADVLQMEGCLYKCSICTKRWSPLHPAQRDLWHPFPLTDSDAWEENLTPINDVINVLSGMQMVQFIKSKDMNFYNIGFRALDAENDENFAELHITSSILLSIEETKTQFWGDSSKEEFERKASKMFGQVVEHVYLQENNILKIICSIGHIEVIPATDERESWRLILPSSQQVAAANTWLGS